MSDSLILTKLGAEADAILDAFAERTGLEGDDQGDRRVFPLSSSDHQVHVVHQLTEISEHWPTHVGLQYPG